VTVEDSDEVVYRAILADAQRHHVDMEQEAPAISESPPRLHDHLARRDSAIARLDRLGHKDYGSAHDTTGQWSSDLHTPQRIVVRADIGDCVRWRTHRSRRFTFVIGALASIALVGSVPAFAHHGPDSMHPTAGPGGFWYCSDGGTTYTGSQLFCRQQDAAVSLYRQSSLNAEGQSDVAQVWQGQYNPTDLQGTFVTPVYSGTEETDIIYQQGTGGMPTNIVGLAWCDDAVGSFTHICDQHYVLFRFSAPGNAVASHETGHAVGLTHPTNANPPGTAMDPAYATMANAPTTATLGAHNVQQINSTY